MERIRWITGAGIESYTVTYITVSVTECLSAREQRETATQANVNTMSPLYKGRKIEVL